MTWRSSLAVAAWIALACTVVWFVYTIRGSLWFLMSFVLPLLSMLLVLGIVGAAIATVLTTVTAGLAYAAFLGTRARFTRVL